MKMPKNTVYLLMALAIFGVYLLGRYQGQIELLKQGTTNKAATTQTGQTGGQAGQQPAGQQVAGGQATVVSDEQWKIVQSNPAATKGSGKAKVTIVEFSDYQCPFCVRYINDTYPQIEKEYIETGKVRYMLRDFPLPFHANADEAAQAARCAGDQGKYWEMHDKLFEEQDSWSSGDPIDSFEGYAGDLGLNSGSFSDCLSSEKYREEVEKDASLAQQIGIGGTPGFVINGKLLVGAQPFSAFKQVIDAEL